MTVSGGKKPYTLSVVTNALPPGLSLDAATNVISGNATTAGSYQFTIQVQDGSKKDTAVTRLYTIVVAAQGKFVICSTNLPVGSREKHIPIRLLRRGAPRPTCGYFGRTITAGFIAQCHRNNHRHTDSERGFCLHRGSG